MKPNTTNRARSYTRPTIFVSALILLAGFALWYFRVAPQAAPVAQAKPVAPAEQPLDAPAAVEEASSEAAQPSAPQPSPLAKIVPAAPISLPAFAPVAGQPAPSPVAPPVIASVSPSPKPPARDELAASARMYAAHASLRTPEVADPDSKANKQILSTMVAKALAQPASLPPSASSSTTH